MPLNTVPNNTRKCIIPKGIHTINEILERCIMDSSRGHWQNYIAMKFLYLGYHINSGKIDSLDKYMSRLQKMLDNRVNKYYPSYNFHIYYGQIGKNGEFGYYLECDKMGEFE